MMYNIKNKNFKTKTRFLPSASSQNKEAINQIKAFVANKPE